MPANPTHRRLARAALLATGLASVLLPGLVGAHSQRVPIAGKTLQIETRGNAANHKLILKAKDAVHIVPAHDPAEAGSAIFFRWTGLNAGRSALATLDADLWSGSASNYLYKDAAGSAGGIQKVQLKPGNLGIQAKGFTWDLPGAVDAVQVFLRIEDEWMCAEFGGTITSDGTGLVFKAKNAPTPAECPDQVCGNGVVEVGEVCDDGNLIDFDPCANDCTANDCSGASFDNTWDAVHEKIFVGGGCSTSICHGSSGAGGLNLATPASAYDAIVNHASSISAFDRIEPGEEDLSFLYLKLSAATLGTPAPGSLAGSPMPAGGLPPVSSSLLEGLRRWIRDGAPKIGTVDGTQDLFGACFPPATPNKIPALTPPAVGDGFQFYAPPWPVPAGTENEVCYSTYYDLAQSPGGIPAGAEVPCPGYMGGSTRACVRVDSSMLAQDPQSHHSIIHAYVGAYPWSNSGFGTWTCKGGNLAGTACNPTRIGVSAVLGGADCGSRAACAGTISRSLACVGYGPPDYGIDTAGAGTPSAPSIGGAQEPISTRDYPSGVFTTIPKAGVIVWNSHAFNLTETDTTMEQYLNFNFAETADNLQVSSIFDSSDIFAMFVPPFTQQEICSTYRLPKYANLFQLGSHVHKRGIRWRTWLPPNTECASVATCSPNLTTANYLSTVYNDPVELEFDPALYYPGNIESRVLKFCSLFDNGFTDPSTVKRRSTSPNAILNIGGPCALNETRCIGGPRHNTLCNGVDATCDSSAGAGDGDCDACPLRGGTTTEDEMFIQLGGYYVNQH